MVEKSTLQAAWYIYFMKLVLGLFILKQRWRFCLEFSVGAAPKNTKEKKGTQIMPPGRFSEKRV